MGFSVNQTYPSGDWLKSEDLKRQDGTYGQADGVIENVSMVKVNKDRNSDEKIDRLELSFVGKEKRLLLNKTNAETIALAYGDNTDSWLGKSIGISVHSTNFGPGILVRIVQGQPGAVVNQQPEIATAPIPQDTLAQDVPF